MSGGVYTDKKEHWDFIASAMRENIESNPLHFVEFAHVGQLEAEVIKITLDTFHGPEGSCGVTSSGGTESIFLAMLAFDKASFYLGIELRKVKIGKDLKIDVRNMKK